MLAPQVDFLFDRGLLSFADDGHTLFSSQLSDVDSAKLGLRVVEPSPPRAFHEGSLAYLKHHRASVYIP